MEFLFSLVGRDTFDDQGCKLRANLKTQQIQQIRKLTRGPRRKMPGRVRTH